METMEKEMKDHTLKIGELAKRLGLNVRTLRYYEAIGILPAPPRTEGGYRLYSECDEMLLRFVLQAKEVGFSLEEIRQILDLRRHGSPCGYVRDALCRHLAAVETRIIELQRLHAQLSAVMEAWQNSEAPMPAEICEVIEQWPRLLTRAKEDIRMATQRRKVEVFTAGCPVCDPTVDMVQRVACPSCDVTVYNVKDDPEAARRAKDANVHRVPMVLVDGQPIECCQIGPVTEDALRAAGVGTR
jgi:DNA-binding transcriptional MerR regulator